MQTPHFSIIIPALNEEKYLPRLLRDISHQSFRDFEVIVVDGLSQDSTVKKALSFENSLDIKVLESSKRNVSHQRNLGARFSRAPFLVFFDADSRIPPDFLAKLKKGFEKTTSDILNTRIAPDSKEDKDIVIATAINFLFETASLLGSPSLFGAFTAFKRDVFEKLKGYNEKMNFGEDSEIVRRAVKKGFSYKILTSTHYVYSLRRFRKEGTLKLLRDTAVLNMGNWLKSEHLSNLIDYPMGGHLFDKKTADKLSRISFKKFVKKLRREFKLSL